MDASVDVARDSLIALLGHLGGDLETADGRQALLAGVGLDARLMAEPVRPEPRPALPGTPNIREIGTIEPLEPARQFVLRLVDHVLGARQIDVAVQLVRHVEPRLGDDDRAAARALVEQLGKLAPAGSRAQLGWVGYHHVHKYTLSDRFFGRRAYLGQLDRWAFDEAADAPSVLCVSALGGAGKSALAAWWLDASQAALQERGFRGALWCSFYAKDFDFSDFVVEALSFVGQTEKPSVEYMTRRQREHSLLGALRRERFVLVMDGLERLMNGYAEIYDRVVEQSGDDHSAVTAHERGLADPRDASFLRRLAQPMASRVLITSRLVPADLERAEGEALDRVELVELGGFTQDEGRELWTSLLPDRPMPDDLIGVLIRCDWHPLLISVLARSVAASGGDWSAWCRRGDEHDIRPIAHKGLEEARAYLIHACLRDLDAAGRDVLGFLATSGKPMPESAIVNAMVGGASDRTFVTVEPLRACLEVLESRGFVGVDHEEGGRSFDVHPIVRGAMWGIVTDPERKRMMSHAVSELLATPDHNLNADVTLEDLGQAISYYQVLVKAKEYDRAWEMYFKKLRPPLTLRSEQHVLLDLLFQLLPEGNRLRLVALDSRHEQASSTQLLGDLLLMVGEGRAAMVQLSWAGAIRLQIGDGRGFLDAWASRAWQSLYEGRLYETERELRHMLVQALVYRALDIVPGIDCWLGLVQSLRGRREEAMASFEVGEHSANARWWAQSVAEGHVYLNQPQQALTWVERATGDNERADARQLGWELVTRGIAYLQQDRLEEAENDLAEALKTAKRTRYAIIQCFADVYLADVYLRTGRRDAAEASLASYFRLDKAGGYSIIATDAYRLQALCANARGDLEAARDAARRAYQLAACDGPPFTYDGGLARARETLEACGANIPLTRSRLPADWREVLDELQRARAEVAAHGERMARRPPQTDDQARAAIEIGGILHHIAPEDGTWLASIAGSPASPLYVAVVLTCARHEIALSEFRTAYESSPHRSLEVTFLELARDRLGGSPQVLVRSLSDDAGRSAWLEADPRPALQRFLKSEEADARRQAFAIHRFDADGIEAFLIDDLRRLAINGASELAKQWWNRLRERTSDLDVLVLAESLRDQQVTLQQLVDVLPISGDHAIVHALASIRVERAAGRLDVRSLSRTEGWSEVQVLLRLQDLKRRLGWDELAPAERGFLQIYEEAIPPQPRLALTLVEEIARRGATLVDYVAARRAMDSDDVITLLHFVEFQRARREPWAVPEDWQRTSSASEADLMARLAAARMELGWNDASPEVRDWWSAIELRHGAAVALRLLRELKKRSTTVAALFLAHHDTDSDHFEALLAYLDAQRVRRATKSELELSRFAHEECAAGRHAVAIAAYQALTRRMPDAAFYRGLAEAWEGATHVPTSVAHEQVVKARISTLAANPGSAVDRQLLELARASKRMGDARGYPRTSFSAMLSVATPVALEVARDLIPFFEGADGLHPTVMHFVTEMRGRITREFGVDVPGLRVRGNEADLPEGSYVILLDEVPVSSENIATSKRFITVPRTWLRERGVDFEDGTLEHIEGAWISKADGEKLETELTVERMHRVGGGLLRPEPWDFVEYPVTHLELVLRRNLVPLSGHQEIVNRLDRTTDPLAKVIRSAPDVLSRLVAITRALLDEAVPSVPIEVICDEVWRLVQDGASNDAMLRSLRLLPSLRAQLPGNRASDRLLTLDPVLEASVVSGLVANGDAHVLALVPEATQTFITAVRTASHAAATALIVESPLARPYVRSLICLEFPRLYAIAREELADGWLERAIGTVEGE